MNVLYHREIFKSWSCQFNINVYKGVFKQQTETKDGIELKQNKNNNKKGVPGTFHCQYYCLFIHCH